MPFTDQQLATELNGDPAALGYNADPTFYRTTGADETLAAVLNAVRGTITVKRQDISAKEIFEAIALADYAALTGNPTAAQLSTERRHLAFLAGLPALDRVRLQNEDNSLTPVAANLDAMFPASPGSVTRNRIIALMTRNGSRAEQLWGWGTVVTAADVSRVLGPLSGRT